MKTFNTIVDMRHHINRIKSQGKTIGFVPTMGYLHDGHRKLIEQAKIKYEHVVVSIFVNPLQFNQSSDLENYPRNLDRDQQILVQDGVNCLFAPNTKEMYPDPMAIKMDIVRRTDVLCGKSRPGHFEGVITVLTKLFNLVKPNGVFFGTKDAQQIAVVDALIQDLNFDIRLFPISTVREEDGLAMSSRNVNLDDSERIEAKYIYQAMLQGQNWIMKHSNWTRDKIIQEVHQFLKQHITGKIDYVDCLSFPELNEDFSNERDIIIAVAVYYKKARLIDNIIMNHQGEIKYGGKRDASHDDACKNS